MKTKLNKIGVTVVATVMFAATLFLSMEKNDQGQWQFSTATVNASGSEGGGESPFFFAERERIECPEKDWKKVSTTVSTILTLESSMTDVSTGTTRFYYVFDGYELYNGVVYNRFKKTYELWNITYTVECQLSLGFCSAGNCIVV